MRGSFVQATAALEAERQLVRRLRAEVEHSKEQLARAPAPAPPTPVSLPHSKVGLRLGD